MERRTSSRSGTHTGNVRDRRAVEENRCPVPSDHQFFFPLVDLQSPHGQDLCGPGLSGVRRCRRRHASSDHPWHGAGAPNEVLFQSSAFRSCPSFFHHRPVVLFPQPGSVTVGSLLIDFFAGNFKTIFPLKWTVFFFSFGPFPSL